MKIERSKMDDGNELIKFGPHMHQLPSLPEGMEHSEACTWVDASYDHLGSTIDRLEEIKGNQRLSDLGKGEQLDPLCGEAHENAAKLSASLDMYEAQLEKQQIELTKSPEIHPQAAVLGQREVEIRQWFRGLELTERLSQLGKIVRDELPHEIVHALMRSPIALSVAEQDLLDRGWLEVSRRNNPALAVEIDSKRAALDRARRAAALIGATTSTVTRWDRKRVLERLVSSNNEMLSKATKLVGFNEFEVAEARRVKGLRDNARLMGWK